MPFQPPGNFRLAATDMDHRDTLCVPQDKMTCHHGTPFNRVISEITLSNLPVMLSPIQFSTSLHFNFDTAIAVGEEELDIILVVGFCITELSSTHTPFLSKSTLKARSFQPGPPSFHSALQPARSTG